jgi:hypothetical protein
MPVCLVKSRIKEVKAVLSSIVQICMGPLSALVDGVVPPPHPAVHNATAKRPTAVICFVYLFFIEPPR